MVKVCEDCVQVPQKNGGVHKGFHMNPTLKKGLDDLIEAVSQNWDGVILIDGMEGCLSGETKIKTPTGAISLKNITNRKIKVKAYDFKNKQVVNTFAIHRKSGEKQTFEIRTKSGKTIEATADHKFFVMRNNNILEVRLSDINRGDLLICQEEGKNLTKKK